MRSEVRDGHVHCLMAGEPIPVDICKKEQGAVHCAGCTADSRRCSRCQKARGIVDGKRGWCPSCVAAENTMTPTNATEPKDIAFVAALNLVRAVGAPTSPNPSALESPGMPSETREILERKHWAWKREPRPDSDMSKSGLLPAPILKEPERLYALLMEHGVEDNGTWRVQMPATILVRRAHLLPEEAHEALSLLAKAASLAGRTPWQEITLLKTEGIEALRDQLDHPRAQHNVDQPKRHVRGRGRPRKENAPPALPAEKEKSSASPPIPPPPPESAPTAAPAPSTPMAPRPLPVDLPVRASTKTYGLAFASLVEKAQDTDEGLIVRAAIPVLQVRWSIGPKDAISFLEVMVAQGHVEQRDGWRSIKLLTESIDNQTPLTAPTPPKVSTPRPAMEAANPRRPHRSSGELALPNGGPVATAAPAPQPAAESNVPTPNDVIEVLERRLEKLVEALGNLSTEVLAVTAALADLRRAQHIKTVGDAK